MARNAGDPDQPVPGIVVEHRLRDAGTGNNWHGRDQSGKPVVVRMLRLPVDGKARDRALLEARELIAISHPHLVSVRDAAPTVDGLAVVRDSVPGAISLARLLSGRAVLTPGEVVTIGVPMFQALAAVHEAGHTHGRVRPEDILTDPGGRPMLTGAGISGVLGAAGLPASDVGEPAGLLLSALGPPAPPGEVPLPKPAGAVAAALAPAVADDLSLRPQAAGIAAALGPLLSPRPVGDATSRTRRASRASAAGGGWRGWAGEWELTGSGWPAGPGGPGESRLTGSDGLAGPGGPEESGLTGSGGPASCGGAGPSSDRSRRLGPGALAVEAAARLRWLTGAQTLAAAVLVLGAVALIAWVVIRGGSAGAPGSEGATAQGASTSPDRGGNDVPL